MARVGFVELAKYPSGRTHDQELMSPMPFHYASLPPQVAIFMDSKAFCLTMAVVKFQ